MARVNLSRESFRKFIEELSELDTARYIYCHHMGEKYLSIAKFEDMLLAAMQMCDQLRVEKSLGRDAEAWELFLAKRAVLRGSTLGSLIRMLEKHVDMRDIGYLKWIKGKRDYFVHRLFHDDVWPGDLDEDGCHFMIRRLLAIQILLSRAERNIWRIFDRAGLMEIEHLSDGSILASNVGLYDLLREGSS